MHIRNIIATVLLAIATTNGYAADTANQTLNFNIVSVVDISLKDDSLSFTIDNFGNDGNGSDAESSKYDIQCNKTNQKIVASLDENMPANTAIKVTADAPNGSNSAGQKSLSTQAVDVVTGVGNVNKKNIDLDYVFEADINAAATSFSRTVTYTVMSM